MFEFVRRHNRLLQIVLVVLIFPSFVVFGIQGYQRFMDDGSAVAEVAGHDISAQELDAAHRQQVERLRSQMPNLDARMLDTPAIKQRVLDDLVRERVLLEAARKLMLTPTDEQLLRTFQTDQQFAALRNADGTIKRELLAVRGMTSEQFALQLKQELAMRQVLQGIGATPVRAESPALTALNALYQQRDIQLTRFDTKDYRGKVSVSDAEVKAYYDDAANAAGLQAPEEVSAEYVVLDMAALKKTITVPEDDLRKYYAENAARYTTPEERRVRHILIKAEKDADASTKARAKAKAQEVLATLRKSRGSFVDVAKKESQDPGSATQGGELDWFGRGAMTKPFEDAAFALKKGELSGVVETDFGFHVLEVEDMRGGQSRSFESVRTELEAELRQQLAQKRYTEVAEQFTDAVDQEDTLKAVADKFKLDLRRAEHVTRQGTSDTASPLSQPKLLEGLFRSESLQKKNNVPAVEIGANQLASARVIAHSPAHKLALSEVTDRVRTVLTARKAKQAAQQAGEALLARWKTAPAEAKLDAALTVSRAKAQEQGAALVDGVLKAPADKLPTLVGIDLGGDGYAVARITAIKGADVAGLGGMDKAREQYAQLWAQAETQAYYASLKDRFKAKLHKLPAAGGNDAAASNP